jgi:hypothetical protein
VTGLLLFRSTARPKPDARSDAPMYSSKKKKNRREINCCFSYIIALLKNNILHFDSSNSSLKLAWSQPVVLPAEPKLQTHKVTIKLVPIGHSCITLALC